MTTRKRKEDPRYNSEEHHPCIKEQELTQKCLAENKYNHDACKIFFFNYKNCKTFWNDVKRDRRAKGIDPQLPPLEERHKIKEEYIQKLHS